jgi:hypothetical protein
MASPAVNRVAERLGVSPDDGRRIELDYCVKYLPTLLYNAAVLVPSIGGSNPPPISASCVWLCRELTRIVKGHRPSEWWLERYSKKLLANST